LYCAAHSTRLIDRKRDDVTSELHTAPELGSAVRLTDEIALVAERGDGLVKYLFIAGKLVVTVVCFWYVLRQVSASDAFRALSTFKLRWIALAVLIAMTQLPLLALRLQAIVRSLTPQPSRLTFIAANALIAIYWLFAQVLPTVAGEGIRAWMLTRFGYSWRTGLTGVMLDRGTGVFVLCAFAFVILLLPSALTALAGYRVLVVCLFAAALIGGIVALLLATRVAPLLRRWRYTCWIGDFVADAHGVLVGPLAGRIFATSGLIHGLIIVTVWSVSRAEGLPLSVSDCAVLFIVMVGVVLVPISVGGWGLREFAIVSLLGAHGIAADQALLFSLCLGLVFMISALPGVAVYLLYPLPAKADAAGAVPSSP
jgi:glycosyltransferase 2 family protein